MEAEGDGQHPRRLPNELDWLRAAVRRGAPGRAGAEPGPGGQAQSPASLRELMDRMGPSTTRAALIYQHRTSLRVKMIANEISRRAEAERSSSGTQRARDDDEAS